MSECRLCLSEGGEMIAPCKCTGSIKYVHYKCLQRWLQEKNRQRFRQVLSNSNSKGTGLFCEICKFEYLGNVSYLSFWEILKKSEELPANLQYFAEFVCGVLPEF
mmetsp:Transcript_4924/g.7418  ORF Transcript_4924/g.7418 Transcript_4924/m.7418 type:complete len:105 (+) Transcript_4924:57-371(+)